MRAAATVLVVAAGIASLFFYRRFEDAFGRRFVDGYHVHHRVEHAIGPYDEPPALVVSTHAKRWTGVAAIWTVRLVYVALLFGLPLVVWRAFTPPPHRYGTGA